MSDVPIITVYHWVTPTIAGPRRFFQARAEGVGDSTVCRTSADASYEIAKRLDVECQVVEVEGHPPFIHTSAHCLRAAKEQAAYAEAWPLHCPTCNGAGVQGSGLADSETGERDIDPCDACVEQHRCPRCDRKQVRWILGYQAGGAEGPCVDCGWTGEQPGDHGALHTCDCPEDGDDDSAFAEYLWSGEATRLRARAEDARNPEL